MTSSASSSSNINASSYPPPPPPHSSSFNTGQVLFDCAKDKSSIVNGKQLLANKPLNVGMTANNNSSTSGGGGDGNTRHKKARDKHKDSQYSSDDTSTGGGGGRRHPGCCRCMGPKSTSFWIGLLTNLGICTLLFAYTLLGGCVDTAIAPSLNLLY